MMDVIIPSVHVLMDDGMGDLSLSISFVAPLPSSNEPPIALAKDLVLVVTRTLEVSMIPPRKLKEGANTSSGSLSLSYLAHGFSMLKDVTHSSSTLDDANFPVLTSSSAIFIKHATGKEGKEVVSVVLIGGSKPTRLQLVQYLSSSSSIDLGRSFPSLAYLANFRLLELSIGSYDVCGLCHPSGGKSLQSYILTNSPLISQTQGQD